MSGIFDFVWRQFSFGVDKLNKLIVHLDFNDWMIVLIVGVVIGFFFLKSNMDSFKP